MRSGLRDRGARRTAQRQRGVGAAVARTAVRSLLLVRLLLVRMLVLLMVVVVQVGVAEQVRKSQAQRLDGGRGDCADEERVLFGLFVRGLL